MKDKIFVAHHMCKKNILQYKMFVGILIGERTLETPLDGSIILKWVGERVRDREREREREHEVCTGLG